MILNGLSKPLRFVGSTRCLPESSASFKATLILLSARKVYDSGILSAVLDISTVRASPYDDLEVRSTRLCTRGLATHHYVDFGAGSPPLPNECGHYRNYHHGHSPTKQMLIGREEEHKLMLVLLVALGGDRPKSQEKEIKGQ